MRSEHPVSARAHRYRDDDLSEREPLFGIPAPTLSLRWYQNFFAPSRWLSLRVAPVVMVCATLLGTTAAIGIMRGNFRGRRALEMFFVAPSLASLTPSIAMEQ